MRDHVGTVELTPQRRRHQVVYAVRTTPTVPVVGGVVVAVVKQAVKELVDGVATESERRAAAGG